MTALRSPRTELLRLVVLVLLADAAAIAWYALAGLSRASGAARIRFTAVWTVVVLAVVLTGLRRMRLARSRRSDPGV